MARKRNPPCLMCKDKRARFLPRVQNRIGSGSMAIFCSRECAARYGGIEAYTEIVNGGMHHCPFTDRWELDGEEQCEQCSPVEVDMDEHERQQARE